MTWTKYKKAVASLYSGHSLECHLAHIIPLTSLLQLSLFSPSSKRRRKKPVSTKDLNLLNFQTEAFGYSWLQSAIKRSCTSLVYNILKLLTVMAKVSSYLQFKDDLRQGQWPLMSMSSRLAQKLGGNFQFLFLVSKHGMLKRDWCLTTKGLNFFGFFFFGFVHECLSSPLKAKTWFAFGSNRSVIHIFQTH